MTDNIYIYIFDMLKNYNLIFFNKIRKLITTYDCVFDMLKVTLPLGNFGSKELIFIPILIRI